jgi:hypothetical protein
MIQTRFIICCLVITILLKTTGCTQNQEQVTNKTSQKNQVVLKHGDTNIESRLKPIEQKLTHLEQLSNNNKSDSISDFIGLIGWSTTVVIGIAGLGLVWNIYRSLVDSARIFHQTTRKLKDKFNPWLEERERECASQIKDMLDKNDEKMQQYSSFMQLRMCIGMPPKPKPEDIYPLLTPLTSHPRLEYEALFDRIKKLDISKEVTDKVTDGLKKLKEKK